MSKRKRFSERNKYVVVDEALQLEAISPHLRTRLWNSVSPIVFKTSVEPWEDFDSQESGDRERFFAFWTESQREMIDDVPEDPQQFVKTIRKWYDDAEWYEVYDFVEYWCKVCGHQLVGLVNQALGAEGSGYRIVDGEVLPITSAEEIGEIERA